MAMVCVATEKRKVAEKKKKEEIKKKAHYEKVRTGLPRFSKDNACGGDGRGG